MSDPPMIDAIGYTAAGLVLATFCMRSMQALRCVAIGSNVAFIAYGYFGDLAPVLVLHILLLPVNIYRLSQESWAEDQNEPADAGRAIARPAGARTTGRVARRALAALGLLTVAAVADAAQAHTVRYVASNGNDADNCTRTAPCKTLQRGIDRTPSGSELIILDSGDFGNSAIIGKSITISAIGVSATLGGTIFINSVGASVVLKGLRLNGAGVDASGIIVAAASSVHIENCEVQNFGHNGIVASVTAVPKLFVSNTVVRNNGFGGLLFASGAGGNLVVDNSRFERNGSNGVEIQAGEATITRSIASGNTANGILQLAGGQTNVSWTTAADNGAEGFSVHNSSQMTLEQSVARGNATGLRALGGSTARISSSVLTNNGTGISIQGGSTVLTRVNNTVSGNTTNVSGTLTPLGGI